MNKVLLIIVGIVVILGLGFYANNQFKVNREKAAMKAQEDASMKQKEKDAMIKEKENIMMMAQQDTSSKKATLSDVSGGTGTGKAFVLRKGGKLYFTATANLSDLKDGAFYEGWLAVKGANPPKFVDTGKLTKQRDGSYEVSYSSDNLYEGYDFVVITWEQVDDQKPEKHILEGLAW